MNRLLTLIIGIAIIGVGIFLLVQGNDLAKKCTVEAVGTVVEITRDETTDSDGFTEYTYYPIIEYKANDTTVTVKSSNGGSLGDYNVDDKIEILYNPNNVKEFIIKGDNSSNIMGIIFIVVGVFVLGAGVKNLLMGR